MPPSSGADLVSVKPLSLSTSAASATVAAHHTPGVDASANSWTASAPPPWVGASGSASGSATAPPVILETPPAVMDSPELVAEVDVAPAQLGSSGSGRPQRSGSGRGHEKLWGSGSASGSLKAPVPSGQGEQFVSVTPIRLGASGSVAGQSPPAAATNPAPVVQSLRDPGPDPASSSSEVVVLDPRPTPSKPYIFSNPLPGSTSLLSAPPSAPSTVIFGNSGLVQAQPQPTLPSAGDLVVLTETAVQDYKEDGLDWSTAENALQPGSIGRVMAIHAGEGEEAGMWWVEVHA
eukprot:Hpha_TRINITY_DN19945_c0_g1::TRINITY_DN19945_c0_g1_i1::g.93555::m.93555